MSAIGAVLRVTVEPRAYLDLLYLTSRVWVGLAYAVLLLLGLTFALCGRVVGIGLPGLILVLLAVRSCAAFERDLARRWLGIELNPMSSPWSSAPTLWRRALAVVRDRTTWKSAAYLALQLPLGLIAAGVVGVGSAPELTVATEMANISVVAGPAGAVVVEQDGHARGLTRGLAEQAVGLLRSEVTGDAGSVSVRRAGSFCCWSSLWVNDVGAALVIRLPPGSSLNIESGGGTVSISSLSSAGPIKVRSASGSVRISGPLHGDIDVQTSTGDIGLELPSDTNARLDAATLTGSVSVDPTWPVALSRGHASGTFGAGGSSIRLQSNVGNITVGVH